MLKPYSNYKLSASPFERSIPYHWDEFRLSSICTTKCIENNENEELLSVFLNKGVISYKDSSQKQVHKPSEDMSKYQLVEFGDLVLNNQQAWRGSVGVSKYRGVVSPAYYVLKISNKINPFFMNYMARDKDVVDQFVLSSKGVGSIQRTLYSPHLKNVIFTVPPRDEQDQIVRYLDWQLAKINKLIKAKKKQIALLNEQKQAIINQAVTKGLDHNVQMKDSGIDWIGEIPKHWEALKIKRLFKESDERNNDGRAVLLTFSRKKGLIPFSENSNKEPSASDLTNYKIVKKGQLLENRMQAWSGMFIYVDKEGCVSPDYSVFNPDCLLDVNVKFFEYVFRNPVQVEQFANASRGVGDGFNRLYTPAFGAICTVYPKYDEQCEIVEYIDTVNIKIAKMISTLENEIELIVEYRTRLISDLVTGKVDVREIKVPNEQFEAEEIEDTDDIVVDDIEEDMLVDE